MMTTQFLSFIFLIFVVILAIVIGTFTYCIQCNSKIERTFLGKITKIKNKQKKIIISFSVNDEISINNCYITSNTVLKEKYLRSTSIEELSNLLKEREKYKITVDGRYHVKTIEIIDIKI